MASLPSTNEEASSPFPPPWLSSTATSEDDEQLQKMLERMSTHVPAPTTYIEDDDDEEEEEEEESWHDAREEGDEGEEEMEPRKEEDELDLDELLDLLLKSTTLKSKANTLFLTSPSSNTSTSSALSTYLSAIKILPPRGPPAPPSENRVPVIGTSSSNDNGGVQIEEITEEEAERIERGETEEERKRKELSGKIRDLRGVCWANVGACYMKMAENKEAVDACTEALLDSPTYIKALHRRATANVAIDTWSSLTSAQDDLKTLLPLLPSSPPSSLYTQSKALLASLPPRIQEKQDKEKDEMIDKLKGLGNSVLGKFGLSTENFKFEPNGAGGYSMNFVR